MTDDLITPEFRETLENWRNRRNGTFSWKPAQFFDIIDKLVEEHTYAIQMKVTHQILDGWEYFDFNNQQWQRIEENEGDPHLITPARPRRQPDVATKLATFYAKRYGYHALEAADATAALLEHFDVTPKEAK